MDQLDIAIHQTALEAKGGIGGVARSLGIGEQVFRNKVCPTTETHKLSLREALAMMEATNDDRILIVLAEMRGYTLERKKLPDTKSIISAVLAADAEHGDVAQRIREALADDKLTEGEKAKITNEINEAQQALEVLRSTIVRAPTMIGKTA